jgi:hypothetical protein
MNFAKAPEIGRFSIERLFSMEIIIRRRRKVVYLLDKRKSYFQELTGSKKYIFESNEEVS